MILVSAQVLLVLTLGLWTLDLGLTIHELLSGLRIGRAGPGHHPLARISIKREKH